MIKMGRLGFEPRTSRLKAECSTTELATPILCVFWRELVPWAVPKVAQAICVCLSRLLNVAHGCRAFESVAKETFGDCFMRPFLRWLLGTERRLETRLG